MKDVVIVHVAVPRFLKNWLEHTFGDPVALPPRCYENLLLSKLLRPRPRNASRYSPKAQGVDVVIPDNRLRKPAIYNYLSPNAQDIFAQALDNLFRLALWSCCAKYIFHPRQTINETIEDWCRSNGIEHPSRDTVRKKFYRMRHSYQTNGFVVGKTYGKTSTKG